MSKNPEIKAAWVAWLRDPKNRQGREVLRTADGKFCCLGGLCELAVQAGVVDRLDGHHIIASRYISTADRNDVSSTTLPQAVVAWAGVADCNPSIAFNDGELSGTEVLSYVNDNLHFSFETIADLIEEQL
jgi:hypothetical protein